MGIIKYGFLDVDGTKIEYEVSGKPDGEPLLLLAGNGGDMHCFEDSLLPELSERFKILRLSTRGTGKSDRGPGRLTFETEADDIRALLDSLGIDKTNIFGFSDGGNLGLVFTVAYQERVKALAVMGSNLNTLGTKTREQLKIHKKFVALSRKAKKTNDPAVALARDIEGMMVGQPRLNFKKISVIKVPFLNIYGEHDMIKRRHSRSITRAVENGDEMMILNRGHGSSFDKSRLFIIPVLLRFFGAI